MDLEEVWKIRLDRLDFSGRRYITGSGSGGVVGAGRRTGGQTRPVSKNRIGKAPLQ